MAKQTYAEVINSAKLMISGLKENSEKMQRRGLDDEFITQFETSYKNAQDFDNEQETLKAALKTKTAQLVEEMDRLKKILSESQKIVKIEEEQANWRAYGINVSR